MCYSKNNNTLLWHDISLPFPSSCKYLRVIYLFRPRLKGINGKMAKHCKSYKREAPYINSVSVYFYLILLFFDN